MGQFTLRVDNKGPLLNASLDISHPRRAALDRAQLPHPQFFGAKGLVDTGASCTSIDPAVVQQLGLSPTGDARLVTPSTGNEPLDVVQFDISVAIYSKLDEPPLSIPILPAIETPLANQGFHMLIGRDILSRCLLVYNGVLGHYTLAF